MKKVLFILFNLLTITAMAQTKGRFEVHDLGNYKLHVYYTNDVLGDASYIIEGKNALVTMEQPLFKDNVAEFDAYLSELGKPVEKRITDYHVGGTGNHDVVMARGMLEFTKGEIYGGMMKGFAQAFGDAMTDMPTGKATEVAFGTTQTWAGVSFASSVFSAASSAAALAASSAALANSAFFFATISALAFFLAISSSKRAFSAVARASFTLFLIASSFDSFSFFHASKRF